MTRFSSIRLPDGRLSLVNAAMRAIFITLVLTTILAAEVAAQCLPMNDSSVILTARIITRTYPGPPNYRDIERGDLAETQLILVLPKPICAVGPGATGTPEMPLRVDGVNEVTLIPSDEVPSIRPIDKVLQFPALF